MVARLRGTAYPLFRGGKPALLVWEGMKVGRCEGYESLNGGLRDRCWLLGSDFNHSSLLTPH